jgi:GNAT superfamily N-acetyltransferase
MDLDDQQWARGDYLISTDRSRLDLKVIHGFLADQTYWATGRSPSRVARSIAQSLPFGLYHCPPGGPAAQVGFARVLTDQVVLAFLADVFVLPAHRGRGLGTWLVQVVTGLPQLASVRRWLLGTRDAHDLYRKVGFSEPAPGILMERVDPDSDRR